MLKIKTYGHAIIISTLGLWTAISFSGFIGYFFGGVIIGLGLRLARQSGFEDAEDQDF